jgi:long-subunit acyl-CoA synthetase (AMP-forming)
MNYPSPLDMLYRWEKERGNEVFLRQPLESGRKTYTWKETGNQIRRMAAYLKSLNLEPGSRIALVSKNCSHWLMADLATMMAGHIFVPIYPNLNAENLKYVLEHSESKVLFVGKLDTWDEMRPGVPENGIQCIQFPFWDEGYTSWDDVIKDVEPITDNPGRDPNEWATIIYTSGTTGKPKGVVHRFHSFGFAAQNAVEYINCTPNERFFSYLPLCHIAERVLVEMGGLYSGGTISFAQSLETFPNDLAEAKPTIFLAVPRIWTKFQQGILKKMPQNRLNLLLKIPILSSLVKNKIKAGLGLQDARMVFSGAAPIPVSTMKWFEKLDIKIQEAYAMTENMSYSHVTLPTKIKHGSVGAPLPLVDVRINPEDEEIQVKHEAIMLEYYKQPEATAETITEDGYLRTGDTGSIDSEGFLKITGRVKDIFKTSKGKYVAPAPIEMKLSANEHVGQVCVVGDGIPQPIALVVKSEESVNLDDVTISNSLQSSLNELNTVLDKHENLNSIVVLNEDWTVENGALTPTMKIKRRVVEGKHKVNYENWYEKSETIIFS